jgi:hypothetical protein
MAMSGERFDRRSTEVRTILTIGAAALMLCACTGPGRERVVVGVGAVPVAYDGYYDGYYGPYYDGYWGTDGFFYYSDANRHWVRDDNHHFRRDVAPGYTKVVVHVPPKDRL